MAAKELFEALGCKYEDIKDKYFGDEIRITVPKRKEGKGFFTTYYRKHKIYFDMYAKKVRFDLNYSSLNPEETLAIYTQMKELGWIE